MVEKILINMFNSRPSPVCKVMNSHNCCYKVTVLDSLPRQSTCTLYILHYGIIIKCSWSHLFCATYIMLKEIITSVLHTFMLTVNCTYYHDLIRTEKIVCILYRNLEYTGLFQLSPPQKIYHMLFEWVKWFVARRATGSGVARTFRPQLCNMYIALTASSTSILWNNIIAQAVAFKNVIGKIRKLSV